MNANESRSCLTCRDLRRSEPTKSGYVACSWGYLTVVQETKPSDIVMVGNMRMVPESLAMLERPCKCYRPDPAIMKRIIPNDKRLQVWSRPKRQRTQSEIQMQRTVDKAERLAAKVPNYVCPICGLSQPGVNLRGKPRNGCVQAQCVGKARATTWRAKGGRSKAKISRPAAEAIRQEYANGGVGYRRLAKAYGVAVSTIRDIVTGKTHKAASDD